MWPNLKQRLGAKYPSQFEGFKMLTAKSEKNALTPEAKITAKGDGRIYCLVRNGAEIQKYHDNEGWTLMVPTETRAVRPDNSELAAQFICYRDVKCGETVALPQVKDHYSLFILAKDIELVEVE